MTRSTDHDRMARKAKAKAARNRDEAREKLLAQRRELAARRRRNRDRTAHDREHDPDATAPTTHSTVPRGDTNGETAARNPHSTVPEQPQGSSVPARERLYGLRLYRRTSGGFTDVEDEDDRKTTAGNGERRERRATAPAEGRR